MQYQTLKLNKMKEQFLNIFGNWMNQAKEDMRTKVRIFLKENDATPEELAELLDVSVDEIYMILDGDADMIELATFGKLLIATGHAIAIQKIEDTPMGNYENVRQPVMQESMFESPRPNPFMRPREEQRPITPPRGFNLNNIPPHIRERVDREFGSQMHETPRPNPFMRPREERENTSSPFTRMTRDNLVKIINDKLWETEIDTRNASKDELVKFLEEKDRKIRRMRMGEQREKELENDPNVSEFLKRMKQNVKENPQLRNYIKKFVGDLED